MSIYEQKKFLPEESFYNRCFEVVQECSLNVLRSTSKIDALEMTRYEPGEDLTHDHWVCSLSIDLGPATVYIKVHFDSRTARRLANRYRIIKNQDLPVSMLSDYMREYLNLMMGDIKTRYGCELETVSVPKIAPTYDQGTSMHSDTDINSTFWKIAWKDSQVILGCFVSVQGDISKLQPNHQPVQSTIKFL